MIKFLKILFVSTFVSLTSIAQISTKEVKELLEKHNIQHSNKVLKMSILETGSFTSRKAIQDKNLFGFETGIKVFNTYEESVKAYKARVESRMKPGEDYYKFLLRIKYADNEGLKYINKIKKIKIKDERKIKGILERIEGSNTLYDICNVSNYFSSSIPNNIYNLAEDWK